MSTHNGAYRKRTDPIVSSSATGGEKDCVEMRTIALLALAIAGAGAFEGCASDSNTSYRGQTARRDGGPCIPMFCQIPGGAPCCINDHCGIDLGNGCIDVGRQDGG
jgi:hypothetical protein